ncbi:MAG TPA: ABC transporter permease [Candidatus Limnocylindrales bacterium]|nr:ABC transporter permease [Candidatus Limnocylindrales bacterium]
MKRRPGAAVWVVASIGIAFLGLPVLVLVSRAVGGGTLLTALSSPAVIDALVLSLLTTSVSLVIVAVLGLPLAFLLARARFPGQSLVETIVDLPIVLPPSVAGLALLLLLGRRGVFGEALAGAGVSIAFTTLAVVIAQVFVAMPFFVRSARAGLVAIDREVEDAARVDGASENGVLRWVSLPLAAPALAAGLVMSWARALGEFGATIMFAGSIAAITQTLPLLVYGEFQSGDLEASIAAAAVLILAAVIALLAVRGLHWSRALEVRAGA